MTTLKLAHKKCRSCYICVRVCPVNAIVIKDGQANILEDRCIFCGRCSKSCPQKYKFYSTNITSIKDYIQNGDNVIASISPNYASAFANESLKIPSALKKLGFSHIEDSGVTTNSILNIYNSYANKKDNKNYITSMCPTINHLIQKHYPELTSCLIPVVPQFLGHSRFIKNKYGNDNKIVFIGSCIAKKIDACKEVNVNEVITFSELKKWLELENINLDELEDIPFDIVHEDNNVFPIAEQISEFIKNKNPHKTVFCVNGLEDCMDVLESIKNGNFENTFFEMNACNHGCLPGSYSNQDDRCFFEMKRDLINNKQRYIEKFSEYTQENPYNNEDLTSILYTKYPPSPFEVKQPNESEIKSILKSIGKTTTRDELNCGICGYRTCREKAIAVFNGLAEVSMCFPYMKKKAESLSNVLFECSPNLIGFVDKNLNITQLNPAAESFFHLKKGAADNTPVNLYLDDTNFEGVRYFRKEIRNQKKKLDKYNSTLLQTVVWIDHNQMYLWIAIDVTKDEETEKRLQSLKLDTLNLAQEIIDKQMRVAQEIASLLGETTAETKVTLTQLKKLILEEEDDK